MDVTAPSSLLQFDSGPARRFGYHAQGGTLFGIRLVNALLTVVTLGIYYFWGKVSVRSYLYSETEFEGDRFAYHGTGKELFIGFLKASPFLLVIFVLPDLALLVSDSEVVAAIASLVVVVAIVVLVPIAMAGAQRYRLSRTSWRGIRFSFRGHTKEFLRSYFVGMLWLVLSLGFYGPYFEVRIRRFLVGYSRFGNTEFQYDGEGIDLFWQYVLAGILGVFTLGIYTAWFEAFRHRYHWGHTSFGTARFRSSLTGGKVLGVWAVNVLLLVFTLGIAWPWVDIRNTRMRLDSLTLEGELDLDSIQQEAQLAAATGEEVADFLDIDLGFF